MKAYIKRVLVAFDVFCNVVLGGNMDETISARAGRAKDNGWKWGIWLADLLNWIQPYHVQLAILHDKQRADRVISVEISAEKQTDFTMPPQTVINSTNDGGGGPLAS